MRRRKPVRDAAASSSGKDQDGRFGRLLTDVCAGLRAGGSRHGTVLELPDGGALARSPQEVLRELRGDDPTYQEMLTLARELRVHPACFVGGRGTLRRGETPRWRVAALSRLFQKVHPADRGPYSPEEVASALEQDDVSAGYLRDLLAGTRDDPRLHQLLALARFFGADPAYFFDDALSARVDEQLAFYRAISPARR